MNDKELADRLSNLQRQALELREDVKQLKAAAKDAGFSRTEIKAISKIASAVAAGKETDVAKEILALQEMAARVGCDALAGEQLRLPIEKAPAPAVVATPTAAQQAYPRNKWSEPLGGGVHIALPGEL